MALATDRQLPIDSAVFQQVKCFDFDERPLGNFEDTPMYWAQLAGEGLPRYSAGRLDEDFGRSAPPSFRLRLQGGNICYEYQYNDLTVLPDADYLVVGYVRAVGLRHAQAFIHAYLVDRLGQPITGSDQVSRLVRSLHLTNPGSTDQPTSAHADETRPASEGEPWQRLEISLTEDFPTAHALRLRLWVLQSGTWATREDSDVDPIIRQDVRASVWFDDITVYRLPRVRLRLSEPGGIVQAGEAASLVLDVHNATPQALTTELAILDLEGREVSRQRHDVLAYAKAPAEVPLPRLEPGLYEARLHLHNDNRLLLYRVIRFAVLPELPPSGSRRRDFGIDLGPWRRGSPADAARLIKELRCGSAKIGLPLTGDLEQEHRTTYLDQIRELARELVGGDIHTTGVMLAPGATSEAEHPQTTREMLVGDPRCERRLGPVLTHLGGLLTCWQLGYERVELGDTGSWDAAALTNLRGKLERFVTAPELIVPLSVFDSRAIGASPSGRPEPVSIWIPADLPARAFPRQLAFLGSAPAASTGIERWLKLDLQTAGLSPSRRLADTAQRLVLAKTLGPERVYVPAPFELSLLGGRPAWQPTEQYIILRTLFHHLSGKRAVATMALPEQDGVAIIFDDTKTACIVLWTWRDQPLPEPTELYLGPNPVAIDLWGSRSPLNLVDRRARIHLTAMPIIVEHIDAPLALLQASFRVEPTGVQLHEPEPRPVLRLRNYYANTLAGTIEFTLPTTWRVRLRHVHFELEPGETLEHTLHLELPPREIAGQRPVGIHVELNTPVSEELEFVVPLTVGLRDVRVEVEARWSGRDLTVEQTLHNLSPEPVSFSAYCQAPRRAQLERAFLNVGSGDIQTQTYVYPNARDLAGIELRVGVREIQGRRSLDQLVEIPD